MIISFRASQDIIDNFAAKYLPEVKPGEMQVLVRPKHSEVFISYPEHLEKEMNELQMNPVAAAEKFVADGISQAVSPLDKPMDPSEVRRNPARFTKPVQLSKLRQTLERDPHYFSK